MKSTFRQILKFKRVRKYFILEVTVTPKGGVLFKLDPDGPKPTLKEAEKEVFERGHEGYAPVYTIIPAYGLEERVAYVDRNGDEQEVFPFITEKEKSDYE